MAISALTLALGLAIPPRTRPPRLAIYLVMVNNFTAWLDQTNPLRCVQGRPWESLYLAENGQPQRALASFVNSLGDFRSSPGWVVGTDIGHPGTVRLRVSCGRPPWSFFDSSGRGSLWVPNAVG